MLLGGKVQEIELKVIYYQTFFIKKLIAELLIFSTFDYMSGIAACLIDLWNINQEVSCPV